MTTTINRYLCDSCFAGEPEIEHWAPLGGAPYEPVTRCTRCKTLLNKRLHHVQTVVDAPPEQAMREAHEVLMATGVLP